MNDRQLTNLDAVADFFGLVSAAVVAKDFHVVRAIQALSALDAAPFRLVFAGGTAIARAYRLVRRMSEDVDFKIVATGDATVSKAQQRRQLTVLRSQVTAALSAAGFAFDPANPEHLRSRDENRYIAYQLPYEAPGHSDDLRSTIQVELTYAELRQPAVNLPVASFVAEANGFPPEVMTIPCVSVNETAAEKLVSLTRRTAMELAGLSRAPDPTLVRHIYDLHMIRNLIDRALVERLSAEIAVADAEEFRNQYPAYAADIRGETRKALAALQTVPIYRERYARFMMTMVYGERPGFDKAIETVVSLARRVVD